MIPLQKSLLHSESLHGAIVVVDYVEGASVQTENFFVLRQALAEFEGPQDDQNAIAIKNYDKEGALSIFISKMISNGGRFYTLSVVFSQELFHQDKK